MGEPSGEIAKVLSRKVSRRGFNKTLATIGLSLLTLKLTGCGNNSGTPESSEHAPILIPDSNDRLFEELYTTALQKRAPVNQLVASEEISNALAEKIGVPPESVRGKVRIRIAESSLTYKPAHDGNPERVEVNSQDCEPVYIIPSQIRRESGSLENGYILVNHEGKPVPGPARDYLITGKILFDSAKAFQKPIQMVTKMVTYEENGAKRKIHDFYNIVNGPLSTWINKGRFADTQEERSKEQEMSEKMPYGVFKMLQVIPITA